jgi:hypothetical protein
MKSRCGKPCFAKRDKHRGLRRAAAIALAHLWQTLHHRHSLPIRNAISGTLPDYLCDHLLDIGDVREETQKADLARKRSYSAGAKLLLAVMNRRVREYQGGKIRT